MERRGPENATTPLQEQRAVRRLFSSGPLAESVTLMLSSSLLSPLPIAPSAQRRSSFVRLPRAYVWHVWEQQPYVVRQRFSEPLPNALFGQPQSSRELMRKVFFCLFPLRMSCRKLPAQRQFLEVLWSTVLVPSLTDALLPLNWPLSSPSVPDCIRCLAGYRLRSIVGGHARFEALCRAGPRRPKATASQALAAAG